MTNKIRSALTRLNLTQEGLAKKMTVSRQTINAIETNKYNTSLVQDVKLSSYLKKPVNDLFVLEAGE